MAGGGVYKYAVRSGPVKDREKWRAVWRDPAGRQHTKRGFTRKKDADDYLAEQVRDMAHGEYIDPESGKRLVSDVGSAWIRQKKSGMKASAWSSIESAWRVHVLPKWGNWPVNAITTDVVEDWVSEMADAGASHTKMARNVGVLKGVLDRAVDSRLIRRNPCVKIEVPKTAKRDNTYLTHDQVDDLVEAVEDTDLDQVGRGTLILVLAYCGIRWGEATGLRVKDVDLNRGRLQIRQNIVDVNGTQVIETPKSWKVRTVPVPGFLVDRLRRQVESAAGTGPDALIWRSASGGPMRQSKPRTADGRHSGWFQRAADAVDLPSLHPHDLRHSAARFAIQAGASVKVVQRMLGHKSAAVTLDVYADLLDDDLDEVSEKVSAARERR